MRGVWRRCSHSTCHVDVPTALPSSPPPISDMRSAPDHIHVCTLPLLLPGEVSTGSSAVAAAGVSGFVVNVAPLCQV